ncbi:hypothetical protein JMJ55_28220 [Belnapia sp. T6]|uniref:Uncharacterized protein n=1 Tax=Belnapia mucosa TaxID=2804532 RepID=A0ABS1VC34_9PROT|nr:hypothetical protein [Belnapia mucosa]MBL6459213.1 hypothetical protein [Belnapia mucosa]
MRHPVLSHIRDHAWLWIAGSFLLGLALGWAGLATPAALFIMFSGILIIVRSQGTDILTIVTTNPVAAVEDTKGDDTVQAAPLRETPHR